MKHLIKLNRNLDPKIRESYKGAIESTFRYLSEVTGITVEGSTDHILDRMMDRGVGLESVLNIIRNIVVRKELCFDIFEAAGSYRERKMFKRVFNDIKIGYSVYIHQEFDGSRSFRIVFRTVI